MSTDRDDQSPGTEPGPEQPFNPPPSKARRAAIEYRVWGWKPFPLPPGTKKAASSWPAEAERPFAQLQHEFTPLSNVGVALGKTSGGLVDVDLDWPEARELAPHVFPNLPAFGRSGQRPGHLLAICSDPQNIARLDFRGPKEQEALGLAKGDKAMVCEVRGDGHYTVFPPSVYDNGDESVWHDCEHVRSLPNWTWEAITKRAGLLAFLSVVLRRYPRVQGNRDDVCMALAGALIDAGLPDDEADGCIRAVAKLADDEDYRSRGKAARTRTTKEAGGEYTGLTRLCELLGIDGAKDALARFLRGGKKAKKHKGDLGPPPEGAILVAGGRLNDVLTEAQDALVAAEAPVFQRGTELVRPVKLEKDEDEGGVSRKKGATMLLTVNSLWLTQRLAAVATWVSPGLKGYNTIDPPPIYAAHILARTGERFRALRGIVTAPTLRRDGSILQTPGYDAASGLIYDPCGVHFPPIPERPSRDEAVAALATITEPYAKFPFGGHTEPEKALATADFAVAISAVLSALVRRSLRTVPLHGFDASTPGSGKSKLAEMAGIVATGLSPAILNPSPKEEELAKQLVAVLRAGDAVIWLDNVTAPLQGDFLCSMLTQDPVQARILGKSERLILPTGAMVLATGNNLQVAGDAARRVVMCRIDANVEHPEDRKFGFEPVEMVKERRVELVVAGLTLLRAYIAAGRPGQESLPPMGSFEDYALVRGALVWLGLRDPCETRVKDTRDDPRRAVEAEVLREWLRVLPGQVLTTGELATLWSTSGGPVGTYGPLMQLLTHLSGLPTFNPTSVGKRLGQMRDRITGGLVLRRAGEKSGVARWYVEEATRSAEAQPLLTGYEKFEETKR